MYESKCRKQSSLKKVVPVNTLNNSKNRSAENVIIALVSRLESGFLRNPDKDSTYLWKANYFDQALVYIGMHILTILDFKKLYCSN